MNNPYSLNPRAFDSRRKTAQEEKLITLKDDSTQPPPTVGSSAFQGIMFGPAAMQPSKSSDDVEPSWGKRGLRIWFWIWALAIVAAAIYRLAS